MSRCGDVMQQVPVPGSITHLMQIQAQNDDDHDDEDDDDSQSYGSGQGMCY